MRHLIAAAAFLVLAVPVARADEKDDAAKKLNGSYQLVDVIIDGKPDPKKDEVAAFSIKDGTITLKFVKKDKEETAKFTVDPSKKPAQIDLTPKNEKETVKGIYETKDTDKGLELTIAFGKSPKAERPKDFKGEGEDSVVFKLLRKKEK